MSMVEKCPWCDYKAKTLTGLANHVHQKHESLIKEYKERGMTAKEIIESKRKADKIRLQEVAEKLKEPEPEPIPIKHMTIDEVPKASPGEHFPMDHPFTTIAKVVKEHREKKESEPEPPKDRKPRRMFSEAHPGAYQLAANMLPRLGLLILATVLIFDAFSNLIQGNYLFVKDWYEATFVLPIIVGIFLFPGGPGEWFQIYGPIMIIIVTIFCVLLFVFYRLVWRFMFKDYFISRGQTELREGRVYWWTGNMWTRAWDRLWGTPERTEHVLYIKQYFWPPLNPFNPRNSVLKLHLSMAEPVEYDSTFSMTGKERRFRVYVGDNEMATTDDAQGTREIPLEQINTVFRDRREHLIGDTQKFSMANPHVRLDLLRDGTYLIPEEFDDRTAPEKTG